MNLRRFVRHLFTTHWGTRRRFTPKVLAGIEAAISQVELLHSGEIRFVVETALHPLELWQDSRRGRARCRHLRSWGSGIPSTTTAF